MKSVIELYSIEDIKFIKEESAKGNLSVIFKYSPVCPVSRSAEYEFDKWYESSSLRIKLFKINVIDARPLSRLIAEEYNVVHQSPQVLLISNEGKSLWSASHYGIDTSQIEYLISDDNN